MKITRLVVKRKDNGKQVSKLKELDNKLIANKLHETRRGGGVVNLLLSKTRAEKQEIDAYKKKFTVDEVLVRDTQSQLFKGYFKNKTFIIELIDWWEKYYKMKLTFEDLGLELANAQHLIIKTLHTNQKLSDFKNILRRFAPKLLEIPRGSRWWEDQLANNLKKLKNKSLKNK